ncbi:MAG: hypothetical protein ABL967_04460 [Bryobacteraceae bacterium]
MRCEPDHFGDQVLILIYIAKKLKEALRLEQALNEADIDYVVEPDTYTGGIIFRAERVGAFFYVAPDAEAAARGILEAEGFKPYDPAAEPL